jgi:Tol biopolymer transport system component
LTWVDRQGRETPLEIEPRPFVHPRIAPDGTRVVVNSEGDLWIWDLAGKRLTRATFEPSNTLPLWTRDGRHLVFASTRRRGPANLFIQPADNTGTATQLTESPYVHQPTGVTPDGAVIFYENTPARQRDIRMLTLTPPARVTTLLETRFDERGGVVSADGRWLAYESNSSGRAYEVFVRPFPAVDSGLWQVSTNGGVQALWAPNGRELFFMDPNGLLMVVPVHARESVWSAGPPTRVLDTPYWRGGEGTYTRQYDISPDGQRFLMLKDQAGSAEASPSIVVVQNWFEDLKRLAPPP